MSMPICVGLCLPALAACAPAARPIGGPVGDEVRAGIAHGRSGFDHSAWDRLAALHIGPDGRVDYLGLRMQRGELDDYLASLQKVRLSSLSRDEQLALFINAYNVYTVRTILEGIEGQTLPHSIRDLDDPWGRPVCKVGGHALSLDDIEHRILRPLFGDARIHAALNCAARSCPALAPFAYRGDRISEQLDGRMRAMMADPGQARVEDGRLRLSRILDWYGKDFLVPGVVGGSVSLVEVVLRYAPTGLAADIEALGPNPPIDFLPYDWSLNSR